VTRFLGGSASVESVPIASAPDALLELSGGDTLEVVGPGESRLIVGGGPELFSVMAIVGPDDFRDLVADGTAVGEVDLLLGGTATPWPRRLCASQEQAIRAVAAWLEIGGIDPGLRWQRQGVSIDESQGTS
jgi:hypothetical protein